MCTRGSVQLTCSARGPRGWEWTRLSSYQTCVIFLQLIHAAYCPLQSSCLDFGYGYGNSCEDIRKVSAISFHRLSLLPNLCSVCGKSFAVLKNVLTYE